VILARNLAEATSLLARDPDYVVLDLMLPDGDGVVLLRAIRAGGRSVRVAVTTGSIENAKIASVRLLNPDVLLIKPIALEELLRGLGLAP
jgi:DNA-binding response OmpR family regulator